ncbi:MAG: class I SAM-dependent methyltransferase [Deltaproteobacteria bacterium]|nr:class I SAM-dependent methyltransferase [Deltaproteobacteria bacterium]MBW2417939.1 class I SAM-dependent methyltransferase [Deltaproteobacteria bacterium]
MGYPQGLRAWFRRSSLLRPGLRILDAGCGSGIVTLALRDALCERGMEPAALNAFDLTPAMLEHFRSTLEDRGIEEIELQRANVLALEELPQTWRDYDLVVTASMLEYVPRERFADALAGLRARLAGDGALILFITRNNWLMKPLIGRWWDAELYTRQELEAAFAQAGFSALSFHRFSPAFRHLDLWGHIVEARP